MKYMRVFVGVLTLAVAVGAQQRNGKDQAAAAFDQLKSLAGDWVGTTVEGGKEMSAPITFRVASGGSVLMSDLAPGMPHEMITMFHRDGEDLLATHYCLTANRRGCGPWQAPSQMSSRSNSRTPRISPVRPRPTWAL